MKIIFNPQKLENAQVLALGNFDGFHLGHRKIIEKAKEIGASKALPTAAITFEPHPLGFFRHNQKHYRLTDLKTKAELIAGAGVDYLYILKFNRAFSELSAEGFINKYLKNNHVVTGFNFGFGRGREGDAEMLTAGLGNNYTQVQAVEQNRIVYSSSTIREELKAGEIKKANALLGYDYYIYGRVQDGQKKGREIGFPTANIRLKPVLVRPRYGVYAVDTNYGRGIANFGVRPTLDRKSELLEVHLFNFDKNIYREKLRVSFLDFVREEKTFNSLADLQKQITEDVNKVKSHV